MEISAERILDELTALRGGVVDTCTLIYLERIEVLSLVSGFFQLLVPPDVVEEFGRTPEHCIIIGKPCLGNADQAVLQLAKERSLPVLSEDRQLLVISGLKTSQNHRFKTSQSGHNAQFSASESAACRFSSSTPR